jgi:NAD(P)H-nitrite reductase large subunit
MKRKILILGSGIAGYSAVQAIKRTDREALVTVITEEPEPTYSACVFAEYLAGEIPRERLFIQGQDQVPLARSEWMLGQKITAIDPVQRRLLREDGQTLPFDRLILATGSRPLVPPLPGVRKQGVCCLKSLADTETILEAPGKSAVVVGSGPVGLEVAVALRKRGWEVAVIELLDNVLPRLFSPVHARMIQSLLEGWGVRVFVGERVVEIRGGERVEAVVTDKRTLACQLALLGIGMRPEVGLAERAGLRVGPSGGIAVDPTMRTSHPDIFACGDCVESVDRLSGSPGLNMLWGNAKTQGAVAGLNSLDLQRKYPGSLNLTTLKLHDTVAASVGEVGTPDASYQEILREHGRSSSIRIVVKGGIIRGIQTVGPQVDMSIFLNLMLCGEKLHILRDSRNKRLLLEQKPWLVRLPTYLRE